MQKKNNEKSEEITEKEKKIKVGREKNLFYKSPLFPFAINKTKVFPQRLSAGQIVKRPVLEI